MTSAREHLAAAVLITMFLALAGLAASRESATIDEFAHLPAGLYALRARDFSLYGKTPPLARMIAALPALLQGPAIETDLSRFPRSAWQPWNYATDFLARNYADYGDLLFSARLMVIAAGALLCVLVWRASRKRYGPFGGLLSLTAAALSPTLMAHAGLVTTDVMAALTSFLFFLAAAGYLERPSFLRAALMALALGAAIITKFTGLAWLPFAVIVPLLTHLQKPAASPPPKARTLAAHLALLLVLLWLAIIAGYFGKKVSLNPGLKPVSRALQPAAPLLALIPLPQDFLLGLDQQLFDSQGGEQRQGNYLLGEWYDGNRWYYYLVAVLCKEPVPHLVVFFMTVVLILSRRPRKISELLWLGAVAYYFALASLLGSLQLGIRYLLPVYPLAFLLMGKLGELAFAPEPAPPPATTVEESTDEPAKKIPRPAKGWRPTLRRILLLLGVWLLIDQAMIRLHYLAYFNAFAGGPRNGAKILLDSNLDWGQDLPGLAHWLQENNETGVDLAYFGHDDPARFGIRYELPGRGSMNRFVAISADLLMGNRYPMTFVSTPPDRADPLWDLIAAYRTQEPVAVIGYSIFVYNKISDSP